VQRTEASPTWPVFRSSVPKCQFWNIFCGETVDQSCGHARDVACGLCVGKSSYSLAFYWEWKITVGGNLLETIKVSDFSCSACGCGISQEAEDDIHNPQGIILVEESVGGAVISGIPKENMYVKNC
jgi:hypothetical protein